MLKQVMQGRKSQKTLSTSEIVDILINKLQKQLQIFTTEAVNQQRKRGRKSPSRKGSNKSIKEEEPMLMIGEEDDESNGSFYEGDEMDEDESDEDCQNSRDEELAALKQNLSGQSKPENEEMDSFLECEHPTPALEFQNMSDILITSAGNIGRMKTGGPDMGFSKLKDKSSQSASRFLIDCEEVKNDYVY